MKYKSSFIHCRKEVTGFGPDAIVVLENRNDPALLYLCSTVWAGTYRGQVNKRKHLVILVILSGTGKTLISHNKSYAEEKPTGQEKAQIGCWSWPHPTALPMAEFRGAHTQNPPPTYPHSHTWTHTQTHLNTCMYVHILTLIYHSHTCSQVPHRHIHTHKHTLILKPIWREEEEMNDQSWGWGNRWEPRERVLVRRL